jgi:hypothetical protein
MNGMMRMLVVGLGLLALAAPIPLVAAFADEADIDMAIEEGRGSAETFRAAFNVLQAAVGSGDAATVASLVNYPLPVFIDDQRSIVRSEADFIGRYAEIMSEALVADILGQPYDRLRVEDDIVVFGNDALRVRPYCTDASCSASYWLITEIRTLGD